MCTPLVERKAAPPKVSLSAVPKLEPKIACIQDDIFNEDYRKYIKPWDRVTQIRIRQHNPGTSTMSQAPTQPSQQQASQPEPFKFQSAPDQQRPPPKHYQKHDPKREQVNAALRSGRTYARPPAVEMQQQQSQQPNDSERTVVIETGKEYNLLGHLEKTQARISILK